MRVQVLQENLTKALNTALRFVSQRAQLPVLSNILLKTEKGKVLIQATNLEISISSSLGAKIEEEGELSIPARTFYDIISNLNPGTLTLESKEEQLKIISGQFEGTALGLNSKEFPSVPQTIKKGGIDLPFDTLSNAISNVIFSVSADETRPVITGVLFIFNETELVLVSTDGFRLSQQKVKLGGKKMKNIIIPKNILSEIERNASSGNISMSLDEESNQIIFALEDVVYASRVIEGEFPSFEKIIPKETTTKIFVDKADFLRGIKLASVFARDSANVAKLIVKKGAVEIISESAKSGRQKNEIEAKVEGEQMEIAYNYRFIEEFLNIDKGDEVLIEFSGAGSPGVFRDPKDSSFLHLIMPVKIQS